MTRVSLGTVWQLGSVELHCLCGLIIINECGRWQGVARGCGRIWCMGVAGCGI